MKEIDFKYFIDGKEVDGSQINWEYSTSIISRGNEIYVTYDPKDVYYIYGKPPKEGLENEIFSTNTLASLLLNAIGNVSLAEPNPTDKLSVNNSGSTEVNSEVLSGSGARLLEETDFSSLGVKHNKHKAPISLLFKQFPKALEAISKCSEYGHNKYKDTDLDFLNFKRVIGGSITYADAGLRHRLESGLDLESGLPHQYHVAWNALAELQLWIEENEK